MNEPMTILHLAGARPNFMKLAPLLEELDSREHLRNVLVHSGQHYDRRMSDVFFSDLGLRDPDHNLEVGSGSHAVQTAAVMVRIEPILEELGPDLVVVVGDVNSTLAAALTAAKLGIPVAHVEAGLRSGDRGMPEELNRIVTDHLSDLLLTPSADADDRLKGEGVPTERIHLVGNIMIDTLFRQRTRARRLRMTRRLRLEPGRFAVATLHRPSNVDDPDQLREIFLALEDIASDLPVVFPMHPRTAGNASRFGIHPRGVEVRAPMGYLEMIGLMEQAAAVLTDSGGIQEETTAMGVPCLTLRSTTERPVTITEGTNHLVPIRSRDRIVRAFREVVAAPPGDRRPPLWDGRTAGRIARVLDEWWAERRSRDFGTNPPSMRSRAGSTAS